ncbi:hypothetical protein GF367_00835 [Candidatus Woesearchaeota archaeon]|nr:hypothetical protein [Candidatus Woesearchaeota archaeon]
MNLSLVRKLFVSLGKAAQLQDEEKRAHVLLGIRGDVQRLTSLLRSLHAGGRIKPSMYDAYEERLRTINRLLEEKEKGKGLTSPLP